MMIRKWIAGLAVSALVVGNGFAAAGEKIGVLWAGKAGTATQIWTSFEKTMKEKAPDIEIEAKIELPSEELAYKIYQKWTAEKNGVVFLRSAGALFMGKNPPKVPGFFGACSNPVDLGCVSVLDRPDKNITGVTYYVPSKMLLEVIQKLMPQAKTYALLVDPENPSSKIEVAETREWLAAKGLNFKLIGAGNVGELITAAKAGEAEADLFIVGNQSFVYDNSEKLVALLKKPVFTYAATALKRKGAVCGYDVDNPGLGVQLAEQVIAAVRDKKPVAQIPVGLDRAPKLIFVDEVAAKYAITVPDEWKSAK